MKGIWHRRTDLPSEEPNPFPIQQVVSSSKNVCTLPDSSLMLINIISLHWGRIEVPVIVYCSLLPGSKYPGSPGQVVVNHVDSMNFGRAVWLVFLGKSVERIRFALIGNTVVQWTITRQFTNQATELRMLTIEAQFYLRSTSDNVSNLTDMWCLGCVWDDVHVGTEKKWGFVEAALDNSMSTSIESKPFWFCLCIRSHYSARIKTIRLLEWFVDRRTLWL